MGQAFDEDGNVLGEAFGDTEREVFDKLMKEHGEKAHELRIRKLRESVDEIEAKEDVAAKEIVRRIDARDDGRTAAERRPSVSKGVTHEIPIPR